jgi:hypothetical protein
LAFRVIWVNAKKFCDETSKDVLYEDVLYVCLQLSGNFKQAFFFFLGEKPYPCRFCGRRFRTNYNKLGHEKKCPDRHTSGAAAMIGQQTPGAAGGQATETGVAAAYR